jgi:hypothetical protein
MIERDDSKLLQLRNQIRDGTVYDAESLSRNLNNDQRFALISVHGKAVDVDVRLPDQITPAEFTIIVDLVDQLIATVEAIRQAVADRGPARSTTRVAREYVRSLLTFGAAEARCDGVAPEVAEEVLTLVMLRVAPFAEIVKWLAGFSSGLIAIDIDEGLRADLRAKQ